ncbi:MAG: hypothetical protein AAF683_00130 [Pseudomonadota bacterium]
MGVQITLFKALKTAKVSTDNAEQVVSELEEYIAMKITEATAGIERQLKIQNLLVFFLGTMSTIAAAIGGYLAVINS